MRNPIDTTGWITNAARGFRRALILASVCGFALAATALPIGVDSSSLALKSALAAGGNGNGHGRSGAPGQQGKSGAGSAGSSAESAISESGGHDEASDDPAIDDAAPARPANARVVREIAGLTEESELSDEEEDKAIRSGWGTWRTADGPESVLTQ